VEQLPARILAEVLAFSGGSLKDDAAVLAISLVDAHARPDVAAMARQGTLQV
jgi:hypothetical protein